MFRRPDSTANYWALESDGEETRPSQHARACPFARAPAHEERALGARPQGGVAMKHADGWTGNAAALGFVMNLDELLCANRLRSAALLHRGKSSFHAMISPDGRTALE